MQSFVRLVVVALGIVPAESGASLAAQSSQVRVRPWEHETSDVPVNRRMRFGHFDNGMRFAWMANPEPKERCYLRLHVDVGSLAEEDGERGMAHFVEHMAFNGSKNFPAGTLISWLQSHGMGFGADSNATTAYSETVYMLDLPESDEGSIREGLRVFRDFADGLSFEEAEVEAEKGVVDSEERDGDSAYQRMGRKNVELLFDGTRIPLREPIGVKEVRAAFTPDKLRAFYERWYRPENATLVLVGDIGELDPEPLFREAFADWRAPTSTGASEPAVGKATFAHRFYSVYEKEIPQFTIGVLQARAVVDRPVSREGLIADLPLEAAHTMLNLRFAELRKKEDAAFLQAYVFDVNPADDVRWAIDGEQLSLVSVPEKWETALAQCGEELRRALEFGFRGAELEEVRADMLRGLEDAKKAESTRESLRFVGELLAAAETRSVPIDAKTREEIFRPALLALGPEACQELLVKAWSDGALVIGAGGNADLGEGAGEKLREVYEASRKVELEAPAEIELGRFAYAAAEAAGAIAKKGFIEDLGIHEIAFENGVRLWIKPTDFEKEEILCRAYLGAGELTLEPARHALAWTASRVFDQCGLVAHSEDDLRRLTAGKRAGVGFSVGDDAFILSGRTAAEDLLLQCELMCAYLTDPGWREEGLAEFREELPEFYEGLEHELGGPISLEFMRELYGGDPRFGLPPREEVEAVTLAALKEWLTPELEGACLDVCFVGDLDVEEVVSAASRTFALLPKRADLERHEERRIIRGPRAGLKSRYSVDTETPSAVALLAFPTADGTDSKRRFDLEFLGEILGDRLVRTIREKLGASYSPGAQAHCGTTYRGDGLMWIQAQGDPAQVDELLEACLAVTDELAEEGVTEDEVERLREPALNHLRDAQRENGYWGQVILEAAHGRPQALDEARTVMEHVRNAKASDLTPLAKQYLERERASVAIVEPKAGPEKAESER